MPLRNVYRPFVASWIYILLFKIGAILHYATIAVLGAQVLPIWAVGFGNAAASTLQLVLDIPAGMLIQRYGAARMLSLSTCMFILAAGVWLFGPSVPAYLASLLASSLGWLFFTPANTAYLLAHAPLSHIGRLSGIRRIMEGAGGIIPTALLPFYVVLPSQTIGLIMLYPLIGSMVALYFMHTHEHAAKTRYRLPAHAGKSLIQRLRYTLRTTGIPGRLLMAWMLAVNAFYGGLWLLVPILLAQHGDTRLGFSLVAVELGSIVIGLLAGKLADGRGRRQVFLLGSLLGALTALFSGYVDGWWFVVTILFLSFADEFVVDTLWALIDQRIRGKRIEGMVSGVITFVDDLGWAVGPAIAGILFTYGSTVVFTALALPISFIFLSGCLVYFTGKLR